MAFKFGKGAGDWDEGDRYQPELRPDGEKAVNVSGKAAENPAASAFSDIEQEQPKKVLTGFEAEDQKAVDAARVEDALKAPADFAKHLDQPGNDGKTAFDKLMETKPGTAITVPTDHRSYILSDDKKTITRVDVGAFEPEVVSVGNVQQAIKERQEAAAKVEAPKPQEQAQEAKPEYLPVRDIAQRPTLKTEEVIKAGEGATATRTTYDREGNAREHRYEMKEGKVHHTGPDGKTVAASPDEARKAEVERELKIANNTMKSLDELKADPSKSMKQGDYTFRVEGDKFIRTGKDGKEESRDLKAYENGLKQRVEHLNDKKSFLQAKEPWKGEKKAEPEKKPEAEKKAEINKPSYKALLDKHVVNASAEKAKTQEVKAEQKPEQKAQAVNLMNDRIGKVKAGEKLEKKPEPEKKAESAKPSYGELVNKLQSNIKEFQKTVEELKELKPEAKGAAAKVEAEKKAEPEKELKPEAKETPKPEAKGAAAKVEAEKKVEQQPEKKTEQAKTAKADEGKKKPEPKPESNSVEATPKKPGRPKKDDQKAAKKDDEAKKTPEPKKTAKTEGVNNAVNKKRASQKTDATKKADGDKPTYGQLVSKNLDNPKVKSQSQDKDKGRGPSMSI